MSVTGLPLLLLLLLGHMLGDFVFQSSAWIGERYEMPGTVHLMRALILGH